MHKVGLLGCPVQGQESALMFSVDQFQLVSLREVSDDLGFVLLKPDPGPWEAALALTLGARF